MPPLSHHTRTVPPSTYISGAKIATKFVILLSVLGTLFTLLLLFTIYICYRRCLYRLLARRLARKNNDTESLALPPRINGRNARFFAPGLQRERYESGGRELRADEIEMKTLVEEKGKFRGMERPGKVYGGWRRGERV